MGGCRCTYRNCTVRSDGKTHLFHYPVFDKVRCNQWLTNARRYDFLHLKVSQLKNRCICQHHFTDQSFMNDMKDKLKVEAVPTIDGPYCDSEKFETPEVPDNTLGLYPIPCEEIENDEYISDRKANYNKKYADFLTNCELLDVDTRPLDIDANKRIKADVFSHSKKVKNILNNDLTHNNIQEINVENQGQESNSIISKEIHPVAFMVNNFAKPVAMTQRRNKSKINIISEKKITDCEKKIPVPLSGGSFKLVSPSMILNINKNKNKEDKNNEDVINEDNNKLNRDTESTITEILSTNDPSKFEIKVDIEEVNPQFSISDKYWTEEEVTLPNSGTPLKSRSEKNDSVTNSILKSAREKTVALLNSKGVKQKVTEMINFEDPCLNISKVDAQECVPVAQKKAPEKKTSKVAIKSKISPERLAKINEKRKFNMKLKDIIEAGLNQIDRKETAKKEIKCPRRKILNSKLETVATSLSQETILPDTRDYIISYLEDRMRKMENLLLNKIDQNTQKIMELKKSFDSPELALDKQVFKIATRNKDLHGEAHKKKLYKEISKYLTPNASSIVYEELFINKYKPNVLITEREPPRKRRRR